MVGRAMPSGRSPLAMEVGHNRACQRGDRSRDHRLEDSGRHPSGPLCLRTTPSWCARQRDLGIILPLGPAGVLIADLPLVG